MLTEFGMASKAITNYARLPSTSEETRVLAPIMPPEVLNFKPAHEKNCIHLHSGMHLFVWSHVPDP